MERTCVECGERAPQAFGPYTEEDSCLCLVCARRLLDQQPEPAAAVEEEAVCPDCGDDLDPDGHHMSGHDCLDDQGVIEIPEERC